MRLNRHSFAIVLALLFPLVAAAGERVTVIISITNAPIGNTNTLTLNGATRTWTNDVSGGPGTLIQQTNSIPWSATNLLNHLSAYPFTDGHILQQSASNNVRIGGLVDQTMTASQAGNWCAISYSTQTVSSPTFVVRMPITVEAPTNQTNIASMLVSAHSLSTNIYPTNITALSNFLSVGVPVGGGTQRVYAPKLLEKFQGTNNGIIWGGGISRASISNAPLVMTTNVIAYGGWLSNVYATGLQATNPILWGNLSIGEPVSGISDQWALQQPSTELLYLYSGDLLGPVAYWRSSGGVVTTVLGNSAANGDSTTNIGSFWSTTLFTPVGTVSNLIVQSGATVTNGTYRGTNNWNGDLAFTSRANTDLANGNNANVNIGTNVYIRLSGASTIATIAGIVPEREGIIHIVEISGAATNIIANESGGATAAAYRITTGTGGDLPLTNNPAFVHLIYNSTASRWRVISSSR